MSKKHGAESKAGLHKKRGKIATSANIISYISKNLFPDFVVRSVHM